MNLPGNDPRGLAALIDHTLLKPQATSADIEKVCLEAREAGFYSVCVNPVHARTAAHRLEGHAPLVCCVCAFPLGACHPSVKVAESRQALEDGAREIDMVMAVGALKEGRYDEVRDDIRGVAALCHDRGALCKVILETCLLNDGEKRRACELCVEAGADFVKTSTGFGSGGATEDDVRLMSGIVSRAGLGVKASGGIRTLDEARRLIAAGATRLGVSAGLRILAEARGMESSSRQAP